MFTACANATVAQTTAFTYQGKLADGANPANGNYDFEFRLADGSPSCELHALKQLAGGR